MQEHVPDLFVKTGDLPDRPGCMLFRRGGALPGVVIMSPLSIPRGRVRTSRPLPGARKAPTDSGTLPFRFYVKTGRNDLRHLRTCASSSRFSVWQLLFTAVRSQAPGFLQHASKASLHGLFRQSPGITASRVARQGTQRPGVRLNLAKSFRLTGMG